MVTRIETISNGYIDKSKVGYINIFKGIEKYKLEKGDILLSHINSLKIVGNCALFDFDNVDMFNGMNLLQIRASNSIFSKWLYYLIKSYYFNQSIKAIAKHAINQVSVPTNRIKTIRIPTATFDEQISIANYLDHKTSEIDSLITDKEELIKKLEEYKQSIITEAVTKGLNPDVKMKDSGIEWIGEIPEHWEVAILRYIGKAIIGLTYSPTEVVNEGAGNLVLRASNLKNGKVIIGNGDVYVEKDMPLKLKVIEGDILICSRSGSKNLVGKCGMIDRDNAGHTFGAFMTIFRSGCNDYLYYIFQSQLFKSQIGAFLTTTINQLTISFLSNLKVPLPTDNEQEDLYKYLKQKTTGVDDLINNVNCQIENLKQYRQSLIYEAVTGKIDVRDYHSERSEQLA